MLLYLPTSCSIYVSEEGKHGCKMTGKYMVIVYLGSFTVSGTNHPNVGKQTIHGWQLITTTDGSVILDQFNG